MTKPTSSTDRAYAALSHKVINFEFKPGEHLNETTLSKVLKISRTPLREALNRLTAEGFLTLVLGKGFFCRPLNPQKILELYQLRCALETEALIRSIEIASDQDIHDITTYLNQTEAAYEVSTDLPELLRVDEEFHMKLAALSKNEEILRFLANTNERIRYVRIINLRQLREGNDTNSHNNASLSAHRIIVEALQKRDSDTAVTALRNHIERRSEETVELVRLAYSQLYVPNT